MHMFRTACRGRMLVLPKSEEHLRAHPEMAELLPAVTKRIVLPTDGSFLKAEVEMGSMIGRSGLVVAETIDVTDTTWFALRAGRKHPSRVVMGQGELSSTVTVIARPGKFEDRTYILLSAWVGTLSPREPWDPAIASPEEFKQSLVFWCSKALVLDPTVMSEPFQSSWVEVLSRADT